MMLINKYIYNIFGAITISIILRILLLNEYGDTELVNEWGTLFNNLKYNNILALRSFEGVLIPTVYMPPLYVYFIYLVDILILGNEQYLVKTILFIQILLSGVSILIFYKINSLLFSKKISLISSYIFSFFPIYVYSSIQISSISIQIFLNLLFIFFTLKIMQKTIDYKIIIKLGVVSGLCILLRGEFILIFFFSLIFLKYTNLINFKNLCIIFLISLLTTSPYLVRNYINFEKITITKSFGYNLWKGNNVDSSVEGSESSIAFETGEIKDKITELKKNNLYDFNYDKIFLDNAIGTIQDDPKLFIERYLKKFFSLTFLNLKSNYPGYYHPVNIIPIILLSIFFILSILFGYQKKSVYIYLILNLFLTVAIFSIFFILPRYKLIILPIQLILINYFIEKYSGLISKKMGV